MGLIKIFAAFFLSAMAQTSVVGSNVITNETITAEETGKGLVVVFVSAKCPCSKSHMSELAQLAEEYRDFQFVGVHSNQDEDPALVKKYFTELALPFPVIRDVDFKLADRFKALKTPHAFVMAGATEPVFQGGVSNAKDCEKSDRKYLREALSDIKAGKSPREKSVRTVGCTISRKKRG